MQLQQSSRSPENEKNGRILGSQTTMMPTPLIPQIQERKFYVVELVEKDGDVLYHFWPPKGVFAFPFGEELFGMLLEDSFVWALGNGVEAEADYFDRELAAHFSRGDDPEKALGQPTFWVKVVNVAKRIGAQEILVDRVLGRLDQVLAEASVEVMKNGKRNYYLHLKNHRLRS